MGGDDCLVLNLTRCKSSSMLVPCSLFKVKNEGSHLYERFFLQPFVWGFF